MARKALGLDKIKIIKEKNEVCYDSLQDHLKDVENYERRYIRRFRRRSAILNLS